MSGVTDPPFRRLCARFGAALTPSEMVTSDTRLWGTDKSSHRMIFDHDSSIPKMVQLVGYCPKQLANAAKQLEDAGVDIIDINMGCPARKVCNRLAGSALMQDEDLVNDILRSVVAAVSLPVTLKIRTGWNPDNKNATAIAKIAEDSGIAMLSVHGRTRACRFNGTAEYATIGLVKRAVSIPVLANGDIDSASKAQHIIRTHGVDGVMIGRAAQGQPWIFGEINACLKDQALTGAPTPVEKKAIVVEHVQNLHYFYGEGKGVRIARKHFRWYCTAERNELELSKQFNRIENADEQLSFIENYF